MKNIIQLILTLPLSLHASFATAIEVSEIIGSESCNLDYTLPHNQWRQIVLPCTPGGNSSVAEVFGDDMTNTFAAGSSSYANNWLVFRYDSANNSYIELTEADALEVGVGYWIIQQSGNTALLSLPPNSTPAPAVESAICPSGCFEIPLKTTSGTQGWNMIGRPNRFSSKLKDVIIHTNTTACSTGCDIDIAENNTLVHNQFWTYDGTSSYTLVSTSSGTVKPWTAYWVATLQNAEGTNPSLLFPKKQSSNILINEVIASNKTILADPDNQKFGDWVELYNPGESREDISGFHLTDEPQESPKKWQIPNGTTIEAGSYLLIWADGKDKHEQALHSNFKLSKSGESIAITDSNGVLINGISFTAQNDDISLGRSTDGSRDFVFFTSPTPNQANNGGSVSTNPPELSLPAGFYTGSQLITISTNEPGATVGYTSDGSEPTISSGQNALQITVDVTSVIRARTFKPGTLNSSIITNTYLINEDTTLPVFSISTNPDNLYGADKGILHSDNIYSDLKSPVQTEFFEPQGSRQFSQSAEIKLSGNASLSLPSKSFALRARGQAKAFKYPFFPDKNITKFKSLLLRTSGQDQATSLLRGGMMQALLIGQMDIDRIAYKPTIVFLNGEYHGIRNIREKKNEHYLHDNHGVDKDHVDVLQEFGAQVVEGNADHYNALLNFVKNNDIRIQPNYNYVATQMDISEYMNYYLSEIYFGNKDWPVKNIRFWRAQDGGKWRWIFYDMDLAFGIFNESASVNMFDFLLKNYTENYNQQGRFLFKKLMQNNQFKNELSQRLAGHINTTFATTRVQQTTDRLAAVIRPEIEAHMTYWYQNIWPNAGAWEGAISSLKNYAAERPAYVRQNLMTLLNDRSSGFAGLQIQNTQPNFGQVFINSVPIPKLANFNGQWIKDIPLTLKAVAAPGKRFVRWEGLTNGTDSETSISLNGNATVRAVFSD